MNKPSITRTTLESAKKLEDLTDWERINSLSESEIEANALSDPENLPLSPDSLKHIKRKKKVNKDNG
ncbi:hypothetical protein PCC8801_3086 [Rippkaea orientalis PCC 8801]|uniref:Uncharacterized protein n=1 Tax=Rippkaea orientalis (strain PCC 8801 / RF-1) TaxID=41431 RepID=B7JX79_RIPO1|nr:hypothetical protein [Rippkaea orientalis]ACK67067.1 hypothetical protein PCC8801_3086 [Rippkaea orientalis PCC 8801]